MTMPTLIQNYRKQEYVTALKKSYTVISQALKVAMAKDGVDNLDETALIQSINGENSAIAGQEKFTEQLKKVFNILKTEDDVEVSFKYLSGVNNTIESRKYYKAVLNDGTIMYLHLFKEAKKSEFDQNVIRQAGGKMFNLSGYIFVDINGNRKPNQIGRDVFIFHIGEDGQVFGANGLSSTLFLLVAKIQLVIIGTVKIWLNVILK